MKRTVFSRIILIALGLLLVIGVIAIISSIGRAIFGGGSSSAPDSGRTALLTNTADMSVELNIRGPIVADESFTTVNMRISSRSRTITRHSGYSLHVADSISLPNTYRAYSEFIHALDRAGFMSGQASTDPAATTGVCATGRLYELRVRRADQIVKELWTSSCRGVSGNLRSDLQPIHALFAAQIPGGAEVRAGF